MGFLEDMAGNKEHLSGMRKAVAGAIIGGIGQIALTRAILPAQDTWSGEAISWSIATGLNLIPVKNDPYIPALMIGVTAGAGADGIYKIFKHSSNRMAAIREEGEARRIRSLDESTLQRYHKLLEPKGFMDTISYTLDSDRKRRHQLTSRYTSPIIN